ncbi:MAG: 16S rRNA (cytosine(967)-C(5))-methyltransferase RsmB, partial [bacterium]
KEILSNAIKVAKRGGIIVDSTCSIESEENQEVVKEVIDSTKEVDLVDIDGLVPSDMIADFGMMQTLPHIHGVDGMFAARLKKR